MKKIKRFIKDIFSLNNLEGIAGFWLMTLLITQSQKYALIVSGLMLLYVIVCWFYFEHKNKIEDIEINNLK